MSTLEANPQATLIYSDMRVVDALGNLLLDTFPPGRAARRDNVDSLLMANVVTGCSCLFRRTLLTNLLPLPSGGRTAFHDHWIACCAAATGSVLYEREPLSDYYQHDSNTLGYKRHDSVLLARVLAVLAVSPALWFTAVSGGLRRRCARVLRLLLNQAHEEYFVRQAFAQTLANRGLITEERARFPSQDRASWLMRAAVQRGRHGIGYRTVALRLMTASVVEAGIRNITTVRNNSPK